MKQVSRSLAAYMLVAVGSMICDWLTFLTLEAFGVPPLYAHMTGRVIGGIFSFTSNKLWSFNAKGSKRLAVEARRFLLLYAVSYMLSVASIYLLMEMLALAPALAKAISDTLIFVFNFCVSRLYVFHQRVGFTPWLRSKFKI